MTNEQTYATDQPILPQQAVVAHRLLKKYGSLTAVDQIDFTVEKGEAFGLLGPNGAGKSTTMRMIYCRTPFTGGSLKVEKWNVLQHPKQIKAIVGVVPQENNLDLDLNVIENLLVYARYFRIGEDEARVRAQQLLSFMGLTEKQDTHVDALSGGMKRRLIVARALINHPRILIMDEPTTGLDPRARHDLWDRLRELRRRRITILLSTHYMEEAEKLCDRLIIMDQGKILTEGTPRQLVEESVSKFVLEIHGADASDLPDLSPKVTVQTHGSTRYYFAPSAELLTPLIDQHPSHKSLLRPSNLEDVFLRLTGQDRLQ